MIRILIIDDEPNIREMLSNIMGNWCPEAQVVGIAEGVQQGFDAINRLHPDLVLLDIRMNDGTGFDLLKKFSEPGFRVIFITAYEEFALEAIKSSALDYILKPVDPEELINAIRKADKNYFTDSTKQIQALLENLNPVQKEPRKIILKTAENIHLVKTSEISYLESDKGYTTFYLKNGEKILLSKTIKDYEDLLQTEGFIRIHKSYLVNRNDIKRFDKEDGGYVVMENNSRVPVSSRKKDLLLNLLDDIGSFSG